MYAVPARWPPESRHTLTNTGTAGAFLDCFDVVTIL